MSGLPILLIGILFGLAMDYEVFLASRPAFLLWARLAGDGRSPNCRGPHRRREIRVRDRGGSPMFAGAPWRKLAPWQRFPATQSCSTSTESSLRPARCTPRAGSVSSRNPRRAVRHRARLPRPCRRQATRRRGTRLPALARRSRAASRAGTPSGGACRPRVERQPSRCCRPTSPSGPKHSPSATSRSPENPQERSTHASRRYRPARIRAAMEDARGPVPEPADHRAR